MDYAGINLTNDRTKQGQYYDTSLGPYDVWAVQFGYTPFKSETEMNALLNLSTKPEILIACYSPQSLNLSLVMMLMICVILEKPLTQE